MANSHMKRCLTPLVNREMQVKTIIRYHFTPSRMAIIKKTDTHTYTHTKRKTDTISVEEDETD